MQVFQNVTFQWRPNRGIFRIEDYGNPLANRTQEGVIQWKEEVPWSKAGYVKILIKGEMGTDGPWLVEVPHDWYQCCLAFGPAVGRNNGG